MSETGFRLSVFLAIFVVVAYAELHAARRPKVGDWKHRWRINLSILVLDVVLARLTVGAAALFAATYASQFNLGLFNLIGLPFWANAILGFIEQLNEVDVANVEPMTSVVTMKMKMRNDVVTDGHYPQKIVANAPAQDDEFFMVPKVVE